MTTSMPEYVCRIGSSKSQFHGCDLYSEIVNLTEIEVALAEMNH